MSLEFDERKLLRPGIHHAVVEELDEQFARFQKSDRRMKLFARLRSYVNDLRSNLISKKRVRKQYGIDVFPVRSSSVEEEEWIAFFSQVNMKWCQLLGWPQNTQKGLVRLLV